MGSFQGSQVNLSAIPIYGKEINWPIDLNNSALALKFESSKPFAVRRALSYYSSLAPTIISPEIRINRSYSQTSVSRNKIIEVRIQVELAQDQKMLKIVDPFPGGFETFGNISYGGLWSDSAYAWTEAKTLSDKVVFAFSEVSKGKYVLSYKLRSLAPGRYFSSSPTIESQSSPVKIEGKSTMIEVVE